APASRSERLRRGRRAGAVEVSRHRWDRGLARDTLERELGRRSADRHGDRAMVLAAAAASDAVLERALEPQASVTAGERALAIGRILAGMHATARARSHR
ncbi:MAG: hypothetical protein M3025_06285, partial [Actinomycetota bacterium]|nr:hypothetical protein [Actinomycetota bacterium]